MMKGEFIKLDSNSDYSAVIYINPETWESGEKWYRFDIVKQKNGKIIDTVRVDYATSPGYALAHAIAEIESRGIKK